jgi:hypothetical protein
MVVKMHGAFGSIIKFWRFIWHAKIGHMKQIQIRAVMFQDSSFWCAQCLEHDVAVQAETVDELVVALADTLSAYVELAATEGREPFADMPPAPIEFEDMFRRAHEFKARPRLINIDDGPKVIPEIRVLEAA